MFLDNESKDKKEHYGKMLSMMGSFSRLFSTSNDPYLESRIAENLFCRTFNAENLSRSDCSVDAKKGTRGIGIKTFLEKNGTTLQKIAEFNSEHSLFSGLDAKEKIKKVANLRNERLEVTKRQYALKELVYHCVTRKPGCITVYEMPMLSINVNGIRGVHEKGNTISFTDGKEEYSFNVSKSTLYKRFYTKSQLLRVKVEMLEDPYAELERSFQNELNELIFTPIRKDVERLFLPLYSVRNGTKSVPKRSGLNQWNARGRSRHPDEAYIPIPSWIHKEFPKFFPQKNKAFELKLPDGEIISARLCQAGSKALMSNPNSKLGSWFLRHVLSLPVGKLVTYSMLERVGIDTAVIYKTGTGTYEIDFAEIESFDQFEEENRTPKGKKSISQ